MQYCVFDVKQFFFVIGWDIYTHILLFFRKHKLDIFINFHRSLELFKNYSSLVNVNFILSFRKSDIFKEANDYHYKRFI